MNPSFSCCKHVNRVWLRKAREVTTWLSPSLPVTIIRINDSGRSKSSAKYLKYHSTVVLSRTLVQTWRFNWSSSPVIAFLKRTCDIGWRSKIPRLSSSRLALWMAFHLGPKRFFIIFYIIVGHLSFWETFSFDFMTIDHTVQRQSDTSF